MNISKENLTDGGVPKSGEYETNALNATVSFQCDNDGTVCLTIGDQWFTASDLKELRKLTKLLAKRLEADKTR